MKSIVRQFGLALSAAALLVCAPVTGAQSQPQSVDTSQPIVVKSSKPKPKREIFRGEVMNATSTAITVRSRDNGNAIRTFSYSDAVRDRMQKIIDAGGYQYGDRVTIETDAGSNVARSIKGKPSRPL